MIIKDYPIAFLYLVLLDQFNLDNVALPIKYVITNHKFAGWLPIVKG
jgi:hypothetical protein